MILRCCPAWPASQDVSESRRSAGLIGSVGQSLVVDADCLRLQTLHSRNQSRNITLQSELSRTISAWELDELMVLIRGWGNMRVRREALQERTGRRKGGIAHCRGRVVQPELPLYYVGAVVYHEGMKIRSRPKIAGGNFTKAKRVSGC